MDKNKLTEMRYELDKLITSNDMKVDKILEVSREVDILILEYYQDIGIYARKNEDVQFKDKLSLF